LTKYTESVYYFNRKDDLSMIREMRKALGDTQSQFAERYQIPFRTIQNWENGVNTPPEYMVQLLEQTVQLDLINRRQFKIPQWNERKKALPQMRDFPGTFEWIQAVADTLGRDQVVFALDTALLCEELYLGRLDEWVIWAYGPDSLSRYRGVTVIGNEVDPLDVSETDGIRYTCFTRTLDDAMANERILDMQGTTEALSKYYFTHGETFDGLHPDPRYGELFHQLAEAAKAYYTE